MTNLIKSLIVISCISNLNYGKNDEMSSIKVANSFFDDLKFELAIIEYKRLSVLFPDNVNFFQIQNKMAICYKKLGYFIESINIHKKLLEKNSQYWDSIFQIATTYQLMDNFTESNRFIKEYFPIVDGERKDSLKYLMSCNYFALMQVDSSKLYFDSINQIELQTLIDRNSIIISEFESLREYNHISAKRLNMLIPGAGYLYLDMPQTFVATLFVESLFFYSTVLTYNNQNAIGTLLGGIFFSGFYLGSIHGAEQFAKIKKKKSYRKFYDKLIFGFNK